MAVPKTRRYCERRPEHLFLAREPGSGRREGRRRYNLLSVSLQQIVAPHWISKGSSVLPLTVNEKNCCGVTVVTQLWATLMELITSFPCKIPSLVCARITAVSSPRSKKIPCTRADAQSLPHATFPPASIKKLEANCLRVTIFTPMCIWNWIGRNAWSLLWTLLSLSSYTGMLFGKSFCLKLTSVREK